MSSEQILMEKHDGIAVIRMDRPPANAFCLEVAHEFEALLDTGAVSESRALVLSGTGAFFSGGLDLKVVPTYTPQEQREFLGTLNRVLGWLYSCPVPVVAAVNGHAVAGAFILVLTSDYRVGPAAGADFGLTEARVGIPFPAVPLVVLRHELSPADVRYCTLHAGLFGPEEAMRRGVLDELQPAEDVLERALNVARDLADMPVDGYRRIKHQVRGAAIEQIEQIVSTDADPMLEQWISPEAPEAARSTLQQRPQ